MATTVESVLAEALRLSASDQRKLIEVLFEAVAKVDFTPPEWHRAILEAQLAIPDDKANTVSAEEASARLEAVIRRARQP